MGARFGDTGCFATAPVEGQQCTEHSAAARMHCQQGAASGRICLHTNLASCHVQCALAPAHALRNLDDMRRVWRSDGMGARHGYLVYGICCAAPIGWPTHWCLCLPMHQMDARCGIVPYSCWVTSNGCCWYRNTWTPVVAAVWCSGGGAAAAI